MTDLDLDALIEMTVNAAQIEDGVNPRLVMARSATAVPVAMLQSDSVNSRAGVWTPEEDEFLRDNLGALSQEEIAACLGRTVEAVKIRWTRKGYYAPSKQPGDLVALRVGEMLGWCGKKVKRLIQMGVMPGRKVPGNGRNIHVVDRFDLLRWCVQPANWIYLNVDRITDQRIKHLVEMRQERWPDEWWTPGQVAEYHGCDWRLVNRRIHQGKLPAIRWQNWHILRSDAEKQKFYPGKGGANGRDWSMAGDAFLVLATAVGVPTTQIDELRGEDVKRSWHRLGYLLKRRKVKPLILGYHLPVQQRGKFLFTDWRDVRGRFPGLCRAVDRFLDGRSLSFTDCQCLRGVMRSWAQWHGLEELAHRLNWAQAAKAGGLRVFYDELLAVGVDPFGGE